MVTDDIWGQASSVYEKDAVPSFLQSQTTDLQVISCGIRRVIRGPLAWLECLDLYLLHSLCECHLSHLKDCCCPDLNSGNSVADTPWSCHSLHH